MMDLLEIKNLETSFVIEDKTVVQVLDKISFSLKKGETLGIVGESGCGKSITALSIMRLLPRPSGIISGGNIFYQGQDLLQLKTSDMYKIRGNKIAMIFQEPMTALNPLHTVGQQLTEVFSLHFPEISFDEATTRSIKLLDKVGIPGASHRMKEYPYQLSGGIRQRVMIAMALACSPDILIADEPTTALDVTIQAQILDLMKSIQKEMGMSIIFITHDLGVIAETCDRIVVMYAGRIVESGSLNDIFNNPRHAYTKGLINSIPRMTDTPKSKLDTIEGVVPSIQEFPSYCRFYNRCKYASAWCQQKTPPMVEVEPGHFSNCLNYKDLHRELD